ncbi:CASTOR/POLLUX-related putative ion channel [Streptomyces antimicrobicus]|uniref:NAD-binding lipoprotein n=1 Tax=Streptomyces antimicrobicus TaxID=2883108 RepID=A0ABS8BEP1_9ACTN|nr:NAD-binding lipoprotein [Streptomyces antimicrobicus]MCB5183109.1 NAD-binding lipoprotein [Streptomyces antimicrobicus]
MGSDRRPSLGLRLRYWFDNTMARSTPALIGWLSALCAALVVPVALLLVWADPHTAPTPRNLLLGAWKSLGTVFKLGGPVGTPVFVVLSVLVAAVGVFFASALVSLITTGVNDKILDLRKGRSVVLEEGHTVLLGWSEQALPIICELAEANANLRRAAVAVLADRDKTEMEDEIRAVLPRRGPTRVICRTGRPDDPADVALVGTATARSVIVLTPEGPTADAQIVRTLLALDRGSAEPGRHRPGHVVTALRDAANLTAARLAGGPRACVLCFDEIMARLIVQTCRQPGLPLVHLELLDFAGEEFYVTAEPRLTGRTYGEALLAYDTSAVAGLRTADGTLLLNPPPETVIGEGDAVVAVSRDDDTVVLAPGPLPVDPTALATPADRPRRPESVLMLGWNRRAPMVAELLERYVAEGSVLDVVAHGPRPAAALDALCSARRARRPDADAYRSPLKTTFREGDIGNPAILRGLDVGSYDHVVVLGYDDTDAWQADSRTLVTLLHLRDLERSLGRPIHVVAEMNDDRSRALAPLDEGDDFVVNGRLIALLLTQIAENRDLARLFDLLFSPGGSEINLVPATAYVRAGAEVTFATVVEAARRRGESALGYRTGAEAARGPAYGVRINPPKSAPVRFEPEDSVIVLTGR